MKNYQKKTIRVLEKTKRKAEQYSTERKKLYYFLGNYKDDVDYLNEWTLYLKRFD